MSLLPVGFGASGDDYEITDSLRFRDSASAHLSRTPATAGNRKTWTWSGWVKISSPEKSGSNNYIFYAGNASSVDHGIYWYGGTSAVGSQLILELYDGNNYFIRSEAKYRDTSSWYHVVAVWDSTNGTSTERIKLYVNGERITSFSASAFPTQNYDGYINSNSYQHRVGSRGSMYFDGYLTEVNFIDGQALTADDFGEYDANGTWKAKDYTGTYGTNGFYLPMKPTTQAELQNTVLFTGTAATQSIDGVGFSPDLVWLKRRSALNSHGLFDTVRGTNKHVRTETTAAEGTAANLVNSFDPDGFTLGSNGTWNNSGSTNVAWCWDAGDNQPTTGISSVVYTGAGAVQSIKGFGFSPDLVWIKQRTGANVHQLTDSVRGALKGLNSELTSVENTFDAVRAFDTDGFTVGTSAAANGSGSSYVAWGWDAGDGDPVSNTTGDINSTVKANDATGFSIVSYTGNGSSNQTIGHGLSSDIDMVIVKNRSSVTSWRVWHSGLSGDTYYLNLNGTFAESSSSTVFNGHSSTTFTVGNDSSVNSNGSNLIAYCFSEVSGVSKFGSYSGTGSAGNAITGLGFKPGFLMVKRTDTGSSNNWIMLDSTRDPFNSVDSSLVADLSNVETANNTAIAIDFNSDGFTIQGTGNGVNNSSGTYIYMAFKGSYSDYVSPLNDTGTIDSRVKANPSKGFSIVSYTGVGGTGTVGHGLGVAPKFIITKTRSIVNAWHNYHASVGAGYRIFFSTSVPAASSTVWNNTSPTSTVFSVGDANTNGSGTEMIAYCFSEVAGYSKFDSYTGTGVAGLSVTTGFKPAFVMLKRTDSVGAWDMHDATRNVPPVIDKLLEAQSSNAEASYAGYTLTFTDTGFELTGTGASQNAAGGTYIYMAFADTRDAVFNFDASGNKNNWLPNNINSNAESETTYDLMKDTPSLVDKNAGNFATLNPLDGTLNYDPVDANLKVTIGGVVPRNKLGTIAISSGKFYWEMFIESATTAQRMGIGVVNVDTKNNYFSTNTDSVGYSAANGNTLIDGSSATYGATFTTGDTIGVAFNLDDNELTFYKNGVSQGVITSKTFTGSYLPFFAHGSSSGTETIVVNFGQRPFAYTPPTGFLKLNTFNLPDSTIKKGDDYFNTVLYSGSTASEVSVTGVGFQPDFVWDKNRNNAYNHYLWDAVRGATKYLSSNLTTTETTDANSLKSFDSDGFTLGAGSTFATMSSGNSHVGWAWKANGSGVSNNDGQTPSTVSANTTAGFSIVSYTGSGYLGTNGPTTVGHGLGVAPKFIFLKSRTTTEPWLTYHGSLGGTQYLFLNQTSKANSNIAFFNNTDPTSTVFSLGNSAAGNTNNANYIAYCFAEVPGYSAFGKYTGNTSTDGPFIYTGFRPAWVMLKRIDAAGYNWFVLDATRNSYNALGAYLNPNTANAEASATWLDFTSNGFKLRATSGGINTGTIIYTAFAENPFKNALAR